MERVAVYCREACCGEAKLRADGARVEISVAMRDPGDGLYRAVLEGDRGELALGVLEPQGGELLLRRRPERNTVACVGRVRCVRAVCSYLFGQKQVWNRTEEPPELFRDDFIRRGLERCSHAWWRREQGELVVALPLKKDEPFPLVSLFCFACVQRVEDTLCAVYRFDERDMPVCR